MGIEEMKVGQKNPKSSAKTPEKNRKPQKKVFSNYELNKYHPFASQGRMTKGKESFKRFPFKKNTKNNQDL